MKINNVRLIRIKRVYYFDHRHGVLKNKANSRMHTISGFMSVVFLFGGAGVGVNKLLEHQQNQSAKTSFQRSSVTTETSKEANGTSDKLKNASTKAREDDQLAKQIKTKLKNVPGGQKWSVYVRDLNSDRMASINADTTYESTSLNNLFVTAPLEAKLPSANWGYRAGKTTVAKCVINMINSNDQDCAKSVNQYADMKNANTVLESIGFKKTTVSDKQPQTTAREAGDLLYRLQNSQVLSDLGRRTVFDGLYSQKQREGIPAGCTTKCLVANIAGESKTVRHDAAIITAGQSKYVVVIMTNGASWSQIADVSASIRTTMQP